MIVNGEKVIAYMINESTTQNAGIQILKDFNKCITIRAMLQDAEELNRNKRKYPIDVLRSGLESERVQELIAAKSWFGEAGHPIEPTVQRQCNVLEENISHRVLSYDIVGSKIFGMVKTTPTARGYDMRNLIMDDDPMLSAFSLRAMGPMVQTAEGSIVQKPLTMICYDWVWYPSHRKAYQTEIIKNITESGNALNESCITPLLEASALDFIAEESKNYQIVSEMFEAEKKIISLNENCKTVSITSLDDVNNKETMVISLESALSHEIDNFFNKFR